MIIVGWHCEEDWKINCAKGGKTDLDKGRGADTQARLCENGLNESSKEREGKECSEHGGSSLRCGSSSDNLYPSGYENGEDGTYVRKQ